jgi:hypothetical protein
MNKILFPFYSKINHGFLRKKLWFRMSVFLYFVFMVFLIVVMIDAVNGPTAITNCYQGLCAILEIIPPWSLKKITKFSVAIGLIYYLLQWIFMKIVIKFITKKK